MKRLKDWVLGTIEERQILTRCREVVQKLAPGAEVILFGSRARGDAEPDSDYDILVLVDQPLSRELENNIHHALYLIELETDTVLCVLAYERRKWLSPKYEVTPLFQNVEREGVLI